ncbi:MAG: formylglycine-generating enzyme family protein [Wenzhouxiangellaceae bacterium]|nr:formylglycine-generating enzyme family protein [Wenzhouxiangellaceae bacterium]
MKFWIVCIGLLLAPVAPLWAQAEGQAEGEQSETAQTEEETGGRSVRRLGDVMGGDEFSMDLPAMDMPQAPVAEQPQVTLPDPELDSRLQNILARRAFMPDNEEVNQELSDLLDEVEATAREALAAGELERADRLAAVIGALEPDRAVVGEIEAVVERVSRTQRLLDQAEAAMAAGSLVEPEDGSAWALYQDVLEGDPDNDAAIAGLEAVRAGLLEFIDAAIENSDFEEASALLASAADYGIDAEEITTRQQTVLDARQDEIRAMISAVRSSIDAGEFDEAETQINELVALGVDAERIDSLRTSLDDAIRYGGFEPGQLFQDGIGDGEGFAPVMVVVPSGSYMMGSPDDEDDRRGNEGPRHRVTFERGFGLSQNEVTVGQFRQFVQDTGYVTDAERARSSRIYMAGSGRIDERRGVSWRDDYLGETVENDAQPVIHVSWNDANAYAMWLARRTGRDYRLPSEAEFEYALRAGTETPYWWGDGSPPDRTENVTGEDDEFTDQRSWTVAFDNYTDDFWGPAPVGSLSSNPFGFYDLGGNVMEWVQDCWHDGYVRAPDDGSAWVNPGCERRVIRGASWSSTPQMSRSAFRIASSQDSTDARVGFRVARDL